MKFLFIFLSIFIFNQNCVSYADEFSLELKQGWNFISPPLNPDNSFIQQALYSIDGKYTNVWAYNSSDADNPWKHYHPDYIGFSDLTNISLGSGYWIEAVQDCSLVASGSPITSSFPLNLKQGWNAIGWPFQSSQNISSALYSLTFGADYTRILRFNPQTESFEEYYNDTNTNQFDTFESGKAYYIYALQDSTGTILPLPEITITQPAAGTFFNISQIIVSGTINQDDMAVEVNDISADAIDRTFSADIILIEGENTIIAAAANQAGDSATDSIIVTLDTIPPAEPVLDSVTSPTNQNTQAVSGTKEADTSILINGIERIALNSSISWSADLTLIEGANVFNITTKDAALNESSAAVAGIFLDNSAPTIPVVTDDGIYTTSIIQLYASWSSADTQTGIIEYQYAIGLITGGTETVGWTSANTQTEITHTGLSLVQGQTYYISVKAKNNAGSWSGIGNSDGITVNQTIPSIVNFQVPEGSTGYAGGTVGFSVTAQDFDGDSLVYQFSVDEDIKQSWSDSGTFNWNTAESDLGVRTIKVEVSDNHGGEVSQEADLCLFRRPPALPD